MKRSDLINKSDKKKFEKSTEGTLSTSQILKEIGQAVNKEKKRREKVKNPIDQDVFKLSEEFLVKKGDVKCDVPMAEDLATMKSLIQTIVRDEIKKNWTGFKRE